MIFTGIILMANLVFLIWRQGRPAGSPVLTFPVVRVQLVALALAIAAGEVVIATENLHGGFLPIGNEILYLFAVGPTFLVYLVPVVGIALLFRRQWIAGGIVLSLAAILFGTWGYQHWRAWQVTEEERAFVARIAPHEPVETYPTTVRFDPNLRFADHEPRVRGLVQRISGSEGELRVSARKADGKWYSNTLKGPPPRYLWIRLGQRSRFYNAPEMRRGEYVSFVVSIVADGKEQLIAETFSTYIERPAWLPVVGEGGWLRPPKLKQRTYLQDFVDEALAGAVPEAPPAEPDA